MNTTFLPADNIDQVGAGYAHDAKWTRSGRKTPLGATRVETSSQPYSDESRLAGESPCL